MWPLIKWEPFEEEEYIINFPLTPITLGLSVDMYKEKNNIIIKMHVPGISPDRLNICLENSTLTIDGSRQREEEIDKKDYYHKEIQMGRFERVIHLPTPVKEKEINATYKDGILKIILPIKKTSEPIGKIKVDIK